MKRLLLPILGILLLVGTSGEAFGQRATDRERELAANPNAVRRTPPIDPGSPAPTLRGRFLLPDGTPAAGDLYVLGRVADPERARSFGLPSDWVAPGGETDVDGRFALRFDPPRAFAFELRGRLEGYADAWRRRSAIAPGETVELGDVVLERPGSVEGTVVDAGGNALAQSGWLVHALADPPEEGLELLGHAIPDRATGRFRIEGLPPRAVRLGGVGPMGERCEVTRVRVESGRTLEADVVYTGPDASSRITVHVQTTPFHVLGDPEPGSIRLVGAGPEPLVAERISSQTDGYRFERIPPGRYTVSIDDPRYEPWRRTGVENGSRLFAHVKGSAALRFRVRDGATGEPVERYSLRVRFLEAAVTPDEFLVDDGTTPLPDGRFEGMFPGDYELTLRAPGHGMATVEVRGLQPGEERELEVALAQPTVVSGWVTRAREPVANVEVLLLRPAESDDTAESPIRRRGASVPDAGRYREEVSSSRTDALGWFEIQVAEGTPYVLVADAGDGVRASSERFSITADANTRVDLVLPDPSAGGESR